MLIAIVFTLFIYSTTCEVAWNDWVHTDSERVLDYRHNPILVKIIEAIFETSHQFFHSKSAILKKGWE